MLVKKYFPLFLWGYGGNGRSWFNGLLGWDEEVSELCAGEFTLLFQVSGESEQDGVLLEEQISEELKEF